MATRPSAHRLLVIGTDTEVGKTAVAEAILRRARDEGRAPLPYKPAASGGDDPERLLAAAGRPLSLLPAISRHRYEAALAPGIADDPRPFVDPNPTSAANPAGAAMIAASVAHLAALEASLRPQLTVIEGAGGWHVPMPGGTWLPAWAAAFTAPVVVVGRLGLGTINHTLLTLDAVTRAGLPLLGFILADPRGADDPSTADNPRIIACASGLPCLGLLAHRAPDLELAPSAWEALVGASAEALRATRPRGG